MNIEDFRNHCLKKKGVSEEFPFGPTTLVFKVYGKIFALTNPDIFESVNLKCDPEEAALLRENHAAVLPGYHMNKKHWNTILIDNTVPDSLLYKWIDDSYNLVFDSLPKKIKNEIS
ncbi:MAG TPA: MmcQ/YjbR family DNA-binding protein [Salinimicrobium sp.]|nr:MmcQ/YjbR family DNA-binding protein [Salinimicrobium sp.]